MANVLVTGATGLIGNRIAALLVEGGHSVRVLVRDVERAARILPAGVEIVRGDITEPESVARAVAGQERVFHAAGMPEQWHPDPMIFDRVNRQGTRHVMDAALAAGVKRVVYTSTMDVFALGADGTLTEANFDPNDKPTAYERSKQAAEREADAVRAQGLDVVYLNPSAVYGPGPVHAALTAFLVELAHGRVPLLPPGGMSVCHVDAVARAHLAAADKAPSGERYLLADEHLSTRQIAEATLAALGKSKVPSVGPVWLIKVVAAISDPLSRLFKFKPLVAKGELSFLLWNARVDGEKAVRELGYVRQPFREGLTSTLASLREQGLI